jgi:hypothetical protein
VQQNKDFDAANRCLLPVVAESEDIISISFQSCEAINRLLGSFSRSSAECDEISAVTCKISAIWQVDGDSLLFSGSEFLSKAPPFQVCTSLKPGTILASRSVTEVATCC